MRRKVVAQLLCLFAALQLGHALPPPTGLISIAGDKSVVLHWDRVSDPTLAGYHVYRSTSGATGPFSQAGSLGTGSSIVGSPGPGPGGFRARGHFFKFTHPLGAGLFDDELSILAHQLLKPLIIGGVLGQHLNLIRGHIAGESLALFPAL